MTRGTRCPARCCCAWSQPCRNPVVALVRGHARAGGVGLVGACDLALASDESTFGFAEVRLGLTPAIISLTTRARLRTGTPRASTSPARCSEARGRGVRASHIERASVVSSTRPLASLLEAFARSLPAGAAGDQGAAQCAPAVSYRRRWGAARRAVCPAVRLGGGPRGNERVPGTPRAELGGGSRRLNPRVAAQPISAADIGVFREPRTQSRRRTPKNSRRA